MIREVGLAPTKAKNLRRCGEADPRRRRRGRRRLGVARGAAGVGHKTASVVMTQAFGVPAFPVDTHIHRLAARWGLSDGTQRRADRARPQGGVPRGHLEPAHLQIIYFGREHCPALRHDLTACPICSWAASKKQIMAETATVRQPTARKR